MPGLELVKVCIAVEVEAPVNFAGQVAHMQVVKLRKLVQVDELADVVPAIVDLVLVSRNVPRAKHLSLSDFTYEIDELVFFDYSVFVFVKLVEPLVVLCEVVLAFAVHSF